MKKSIYQNKKKIININALVLLYIKENTRGKCLSSISKKPLKNQSAHIGQAGKKHSDISVKFETLFCVRTSADCWPRKEIEIENGSQQFNKLMFQQNIEGQSANQKP